MKYFSEIKVVNDLPDNIMLAVNPSADGITNDVFVFQGQPDPASKRTPLKKGDAVPTLFLQNLKPRKGVIHCVREER